MSSGFCSDIHEIETTYMYICHEGGCELSRGILVAEYIEDIEQSGMFVCISRETLLLRLELVFQGYL